MIHRSTGLSFVAVIVMMLGFGSNAPAQTAAVPVGSFLNSLGVCTHISQGKDDPGEVATSLIYLGLRNIRDDGTTDPDTLQDFIDIYTDTGAKLCMLPIDGDVEASLSEYETIAGAHALLAVEGPNEINNNPFSYENSGPPSGTTYLPEALFQRDLYLAVKADSALAGIPVFAPSEAGGSEPDNVGFQFLTIPTGSGLSMADGTVYGDYANVHNYICTNLTVPINNTAWQAEDPTLNSAWDCTYAEYGVTWRNHFTGYPIAQLPGLLRMTSET